MSSSIRTMSKNLYSRKQHALAAFKQASSITYTVLDAAGIPFAKAAPALVNQIVDAAEVRIFLQFTCSSYKIVHTVGEKQQRRMREDITSRNCIG